MHAAFAIRDNGSACQPDLFLLALPGTAIIFNILDKGGRFGGLWVIMFGVVRISVLTYLHCQSFWVNIKMTKGNNVA